MPCTGPGDTKIHKDVYGGEDAKTKIMAMQFEESILILEAGPRSEAGRGLSKHEVGK